MEPGVQIDVFMIAGASSGPGYAIAKNLAEEGRKCPLPPPLKKDRRMHLRVAAKSGLSKVNGH